MRLCAVRVPVPVPLCLCPCAVCSLWGCCRFQHQGFGTLLMEEAERIAREEHGSTKLAVIAGVGTRNYYRKLGYSLEGPYMVKSLEY